MKKNKVFLGGTCNGSTWRDELIPMLEIDYFNPVVPNWTQEDQKKEIKERTESDFCLYTITPKMSGVYSIAEVVDDSNKRPKSTIFVFLISDEDKAFTIDQYKSILAVEKLLIRNGVVCFDKLDDVAKWLNNQ